MATSPPEQDLAGRRLGDYHLLRLLGRGAMAEVYLAEQVSLKRRVAFKVLRDSLSGDATYVRRFHREAQAAASLIHAHIVQIYEVGCIDGVHFIAQEYVAGANLQQALARSGPPDLPIALTIMRQSASALQRASEQGIVHRDIKPENIMLGEHGEVKVADFGLARLSGENEASNLTQAGYTMGTPLYMSPEQVEGRELDSRSDIYSLGVTCYQMFTGEPPFRGETALSVAVQHLQNDPAPLSQARPDLPPELCRIVHKMLAKNLNDRYATARELIQELRSLPLAPDDHDLLDHWQASQGGEPWRSGTGLQAAIGALPSRQASVAQLSGLMRTTAPRPAWRWDVTIAVVALAAAFAGGLGWSWHRRPEPIESNSAGAKPQIEKRPSAAAQYVYAEIADTEEAWRSVIVYYPKTYFALRADQQLARLYLEQEDYARAAPLFARFEDPDDAMIKQLKEFGAPRGTNEAEQAAQLQAFGMAGSAVALHHLGHTGEAAEKLAELWPERRRLDPQMKNWIVQLINKSGRDHFDNTLQQWDQFLEPGKPRPSVGKSGDGKSGERRGADAKSSDGKKADSKRGS